MDKSMGQPGVAPSHEEAPGERRQIIRAIAFV